MCIHIPSVEWLAGRESAQTVIVCAAVSVHHAHWSVMQTAVAAAVEQHLAPVATPACDMHVVENNCIS